MASADAAGMSARISPRFAPVATGPLAAGLLASTLLSGCLAVPTQPPRTRTTPLDPMLQAPRRAAEAAAAAEAARRRSEEAVRQAMP